MTKDFQVRCVEGSRRFSIWDQDLTTMMKWVRVGGGPQDAGVYHEMLNNSACGRWRNRAWRPLGDGRVVRRCFVDGEKVSSDLPRDPRARQAPLVGAACAARTGAPSA